MWRNLVNIGIVCLLLGGAVSCGRTDVYNEFNTLPKNGWFKRDVQRFTPEVPDTVNRYDVYLSLRHNGRIGICGFSFLTTTRAEF